MICGFHGDARRDQDFMFIGAQMAIMTFGAEIADNPLRSDLHDLGRQDVYAAA